MGESNFKEHVVAQGELLIFLFLIFSFEIFASTEILSAFNLINSTYIKILWAILIPINCYIVFRIKPFNFNIKITNRKLSALLFSILFVLFVVAIVAKPNTWDSMTYHLSRVNHWRQNQNVEHYSTSIDRQIKLQPFAEYITLQIKLLFGFDNLTNLVQYFYSIISIFIVGLISWVISKNKRAVLLSMLVAVTIPMGILQSTSTQNDYVEAGYICTTLYFVALSIKFGSNQFRNICIALSVSFAIITKGTGYIFILPILLAYLTFLIFHNRRNIIKYFLVGTLIIAIINVLYFLRNLETYGELFGGYYDLNNSIISFASIYSNLLKNISLHFATPLDSINEIIYKITITLNKLSGLSIDDPRLNWEFSPQFTIAHSTLHEDYAGNPLHALLFIIFGVYIIIKWRSIDLIVRGYFLVLIVMFILFGTILKWQIWHPRLHLPMFLAASAFLGILLSKINFRLQNTIIVLFVLYAIPFLIYNWSRPLIGNNSIFTNSKYDQYFFNQPASEKPFFDMSAIIQRNNLKNIGWAITGDSWEYPMWVLLQDEKNLRMEHILVQNESAKYEDENFIPDGIINITQEPDSVGRIYYHNTAYQLVYENRPWMFMQKVSQ